MKRLLNLQNNVVIASVFAGLLITVSSFSFSPDEDAQLVGDPPQKKVQRVKVIVSKDGKETKIDTTFNLADERMVSAKVDSVLRELEIDEFGPGMEDIVIHKGGKRMKCTVTGDVKTHGDERFDIFIQHDDSAKTGEAGKVIRIKEFRNRLNMDGSGTGNFLPPPPPMPQHTLIMHKQHGLDPYAFDTKDESVVSYEKKDIGDGLEKITIVRKKREDHPMKETKVKGELPAKTSGSKEVK
jgi:hypothetical protein